MVNYDIIDEVGYSYPDILVDIINRTLLLENAKDAIFSIIFVSKDKIRKLNNSYRGIDKHTDVISFAFEDNKNIEISPRVLGDIFICIDIMKEQAIEYGHSQTREICFLTVHGLLHLLGYDHMDEKDEIKMFAKQEEILNEYEDTRKTKVSS